MLDAVACESIDTDGDGLSDVAEQRGWRVIIELSTRRGQHEGEAGPGAQTDERVRAQGDGDEGHLHVQPGKRGERERREGRHREGGDHRIEELTKKLAHLHKMMEELRRELDKLRHDRR